MGNGTSSCVTKKLSGKDGSSFTDILMVIGGSTSGAVFPSVVELGST
jgi:hypothetical protein